ncbi:ABC transporter permease [Nocardioides sp.]|uniref:ABC transporter permease n=1 Tax=Nocardioides sp. TaxID=35761 RepID=UPI002ED0AE4C
MSTPLDLAVRDSVTMSRRSLRRLVRYPSLTVIVVGMPLVFLLLFVFVFGETLGAGLGGVEGGRSEYLRYVVPGVLVMALASVATSTAISIAMDMTEGIIARFKTMPIARVSVLSGHVVGALVQSVVAFGAVLLVAIALGYRTGGSAGDLLVAAGLVVAVSLALTWLSVMLGIGAKSVETASNSPMILVLLPFLSSGFVPTETLPTGLAWFAEYQPFTPVIEALRGALDGTGAGTDGWVALGWCAVVGLGGYLGSRRIYDRDPTT